MTVSSAGYLCHEVPMSCFSEYAVGRRINEPMIVTIV